MQFTRLTGFTFSRTEAFELYKGQGFRKAGNHYILTSEWFRWLAVESLYTHGSAINYYPASGYAPFLADSRYRSLSVTLRPTSRLRLDEQYIYSHLRTRPGLAVYNNHIMRSKLNYQFNRELSLRAIVDYSGVLPNASLVNLQRTKRLSYDFLLTYLLHPGTAFYLGYTDIYENLLFDPSRPPYLQLTGSPNLNTGRQVFVKLSYLFRF
jgi:hypothetical protein